MTFTTISVLEWVIIALALLAITLYIVYTIYRKKHPKKKDNDDE